MKHNKKAFTVVELVIVIAILAILAAVLIPTFVGLVEKANESNTLKLVKNLNTALKADMPDGKHPTMQSALDAAKAFGYDVEKINANKSATGDNEILWDSVNDCFVYVKGDEMVYVPDSNLSVSKADMKKQLYKYWAVSDTVSGTYSTYLFGFTGTEITGLKTGVDVGETTGITKIEYVGNSEKQEVTIRTNGGVLTVNAGSDTVNHYSDANAVEISDVALYNEFGSVMKAALTVTGKGSVTVKDGAFVNKVILPGSETADVDVSFDKNSTVRSVEGNSALVKSNPNQIVAVTEQDKADVSQKISASLADIDRIFNKVAPGNYDEKTYLDALKTAGITDEVSLYYVTDFAFSGTVQTVEIDGVAYKAGDTQKYSMGKNAMLDCEVFKVIDGKLCINKISYLSALSRKQVLKVNGTAVSVKEDCYDVDTEKTLTVGAPVFTTASDGYVETVSANEYNVYFYAGQSFGRVGFSVAELKAGNSAILYKKIDGKVSYSTDEYTGKDFGSYPLGYNADKKAGSVRTFEATYFVFDENGDYAGVFTVILHCSVVDR